VVAANPIDDTRPVGDQRYWIRTIVADDCGRFSNTLDEKTGILYYEGTDNSKLPDTHQGDFSTLCADEPYESLVPVVPWTIGKPSNPGMPEPLPWPVTQGMLTSNRGREHLASGTRPTI
jgi:hypothetical protein